MLILICKNRLYCPYSFKLHLQNKYAEMKILQQAPALLYYKSETLCNFSYCNQAPLQLKAKKSETQSQNRIRDIKV